MSYRIDGVDIPKPTKAGWNKRESLGQDGLGKPAYAFTRDFELEWEYISVGDASTIYGLFNAGQSSGTHVVSLPEYGAPAWTFKEYSGCQLEEPVFGKYFEEHVENFSLLIVSIRG